MTAFLEPLCRRLHHLHPSARVEPDYFASGAAMLDVVMGGRVFVMECDPDRGFGVDEVRADEGFNTAYRHRYASFEEAERQLLLLLATAEADHAEQQRTLRSAI